VALPICWVIQCNSESHSGTLNGQCSGVRFKLCDSTLAHGGGKRLSDFVETYAPTDTDIGWHT
jgi:hypothetical protein